MFRPSEKFESISYYQVHIFYEKNGYGGIQISGLPSEAIDPSYNSTMN